MAVGGQANDLEPAVGIGHVEERAVADPATADVDAPLARHDPGLAGGDVDEGDLRCLRDVRPALGHHRDPAAVGRPLERVDVDAAPGQDGRSRRLRLGRRPATPRDRRIDQPDLGPAAPSRQERQPVAVGRPARSAATAGLADDFGQARAVRLDDPDLLVPDERDAPAVGRPLGIGCGLVRGGQLGRIPAPQRQGEDLARTGGLGGVGHGPVARMEAELAGRGDGHDRFDREVGRRRGRGGRHQARPVGRRVAHHGPSIARCFRT